MLRRGDLLEERIDNQENYRSQEGDDTDPNAVIASVIVQIVDALAVFRTAGRNTSEHDDRKELEAADNHARVAEQNKSRRDFHNEDEAIDMQAGKPIA